MWNSIRAFAHGLYVVLRFIVKLALGLLCFWLVCGLITGMMGLAVEGLRMMLTWEEWVEIPLGILCFVPIGIIIAAVFWFCNTWGNFEGAREWHLQKKN